MNNTKKCGKCHQGLSLDNFWKHPLNKDGLQNYCKKCSAAASAASKLRTGYKPHPNYWRKWRQNNLEKCRAAVRRYKKNHPDRVRCTHIKRMYGITKETYKDLYNAQNGCCAICGLKEEDVSRLALAVDHDHKCCPDAKSCGKCIRGLLCVMCNGLIGMAKDSIDTLNRAITYIEKSK